MGSYCPVLKDDCTGSKCVSWDSGKCGTLNVDIPVPPTSAEERASNLRYLQQQWDTKEQERQKALTFLGEGGTVEDWEDTHQETLHQVGIFRARGGYHDLCKQMEEHLRQEAGASRHRNDESFYFYSSLLDTPKDIHEQVGWLWDGQSWLPARETTRPRIAWTAGQVYLPPDLSPYPILVEGLEPIPWERVQELRDQGLYRDVSDSLLPDPER